MSRTTRCPDRSEDNDDGVAMVIVLLVMVVLTTLGFAMTNVAVNNLNNAGRDRVGGGALGAAEAGLAQAVAHLRTVGVNNLATTDWGTTGHVVPLDGGRQYTVVISTVVALDIGNGVREGIYEVRSTGTAGSGPGKQIVEETVSVKPFDFPLGIFTRDNLTASGQVPIFTESVLSRGCINDRDKLTFTGYDAAYKDALGQPVRAAAHSVGYITRANSCSSNPLTDSQRIHPNGFPRYCAASPFKYDQDALGGRLDDPGSDPSCGALADQYSDFIDPKNPAAGTEETSKFTIEKLERIYGYKPRALSDAQYAAMKLKARGDKTYFEVSGNTVQAGALPLPCGAAPCPAGKPLVTYPVVYIKAPAGTTVKFQNTDLAGYKYPAIDSPCPTVPSVIIVVEGGGNLEFAGSQAITGSIFVPDGNFNFQAGEVVGTVFAKNLQLTGNSVMRQTPCSLRNMSGSLLTVDPQRFHQDDAS